MYHLYWDIENQPNDTSWLRLVRFTKMLKVIVYKYSRCKEPDSFRKKLKPDQYSVTNFTQPAPDKADKLLLARYKKSLKKKEIKPNDTVILITKDKGLIKRFRSSAQKNKTKILLKTPSKKELEKETGNKKKIRK